MPGVAPAAAPARRRTPRSQRRPRRGAAALRPTVLTRRGTDVLVRIERMMDDASRALSVAAGAVLRAAWPADGASQIRRARVRQRSGPRIATSADVAMD